MQELTIFPAIDFCVDKPNVNHLTINGDSYFAALDKAIASERLFVLKYPDVDLRSGMSVNPRDIIGRVEHYSRDGDELKIGVRVFHAAYDEPSPRFNGVSGKFLGKVIDEHHNVEVEKFLSFHLTV